MTNVLKYSQKAPQLFLLVMFFTKKSKYVELMSQSHKERSVSQLLASITIRYQLILINLNLERQGSKSSTYVLSDQNLEIK